MTDWGAKFYRMDLKAKSMIHLIGVGAVSAIPAETVAPGMHIMYNYGGTATVISVTRKGAQGLVFTESAADYHEGAPYTRNRRIGTLVCAYFPKVKVTA